MLSQVAQVIACRTLRASNWCHHINVAMTRWGINTPARIAHFLAQVAVESDRLSRLEEGLSYSAERFMAIWSMRFSTLGQVSSMPETRGLWRTTYMAGARGTRSLTTAGSIAVEG
jgi:predicted chitinase